MNSWNFKYIVIEVIILEHFGEIFRNLRKSNNMSMSQVVGKEFSVATLSSFEKGNSMLTIDKFYYILEKIGITIEEFEYIANGHDFNQFYQLANKLSTYYNENNEFALKKLLSGTKSEITDTDPKSTMNYLMIKSVLSQFDASYLLTEKEALITSDYLFSLDEWSYYQLILYSNTIKSFTFETIDSLSRELLQRASFYKAIPRNKKLIIEILLNTTIVLAEHKKSHYTKFFRNAIRELLVNETMIYEKTVFLFICGFIDFQDGKIDKGKSKMQDAIDVLNKVGSYHLAKSYQEDYDKVVGKN